MTKIAPSIRNAQIESLMKQLLHQAEAGSYHISPNIQQKIEYLFGKKTPWGFREVTLVVAVARLINPAFLASEDFYACNPRSLYEKPIKNILDQWGIPSRQSGPLNVAKSIKKLDRQWAAGREPRDVAETVADLVLLIEQMSPDQLEQFIAGLLARFLQERNNLTNLSVNAQPNADINHLYNICITLIDKSPDRGNTPQRIIGYLLQSYHKSLKTGINVSGHEDRASATNVTSKKFADVIEEDQSGHILMAYEVTVKPFGHQRVREAYESVDSYRSRGKPFPPEIVVICRRKDVHPDIAAGPSTYLGTLDYQDITFQFLEIHSWILAQLSRMTIQARLAFYNQLHTYITDINTSEDVKQIWSELHTTTRAGTP